MATLYTQQDSNVRRTWLLMAGFLIVIIAVGYLFSAVYNNPGILYAAVIFSLILNFASYWWSDKVVISMTGARPASHDANRELYHLVENLSITAGLPMPRVYIVDDPAPNAFATGRNKEHSVVAVTTGLLALLDKTELEGVIAHELSHIGNRDILLSTVVVVLAGFLAIASDFFMRSLWWGRGRDRDREGNGVLLVLGIVAAILAPIAATLIQLAISRRREFLADASGALLTRYPEGLASALVKISHASQPMMRASNATAHLFIANPFGPRAGQGLAKLFMTHPPVEDRVSALLGEKKSE
jgi:heat shock protein HtpX